MDYKIVVNTVNEVLKQYDMQVTLRQIYYRLISDPYLLFANTRSNYNYLSKILVKAREEGEINESRIIDSTRKTIGGDYGFEGMEHFLKYIVRDFLNSPGTYRRKMWENQDIYPLVWVEKDALSRVVSIKANDFSVITAPSRGYSSYSYIKDIISDLPEGKQIIVLHFGDHDPSGIDMTRDLQDRFNKYAPELNIEVQRIALTIDQVKNYKLAPNPTKLADPRSRNYVQQFGNKCWELDAIKPDVLQDIVKNVIQEQIDVGKWNETVRLVEEEKLKLSKKIKKLKPIFEKELKIRGD